MVLQTFQWVGSTLAGMFCKAGNFVPVPGESVRGDGMAGSRRRFGEKIKQRGCADPSAAFGHQTQRVLDPLRGIEVNIPHVAGAQSVRILS